MKRIHVVFSCLLMGSIFLYACKKNVVDEQASSASPNRGINEEFFDGNSTGSVYVMNNAPAGNQVIVFNRSSDGTLSAGSSFATGGTGTGAGIGTQGSVTLQEGNGHELLFVVNPGSNELSVFRTKGQGLQLLDKVSSHGTLPISVTAHGDLVYVLNGGGKGNISGFRISDAGHLYHLSNSERALSSDDAGPADIEFNNDGSQLVVTEKNTNRISTYRVFSDGRTSNVNSRPSVGTTPFGFAFDNHDQLIVADAFGGMTGQSALTSYRQNHFGQFSLIDGPEPTHQTSACWLVITNNGKYCYTTNTGSGTISGYRIQDGRLSLLNSDGVTATTGTTPGDVALTANSKFLYNLNSTSHSLTLFRVNENGSLSALGSVNDIPAGAVGIAAK